ncbi:MAG: penicillin-binding protein 1C [Rhodobacteraceae bacterium]|uniref:penicillin-binding protein 1C n=1 Tax=Albidovulum sp. TaxID=1872424 RepID=UPI001E14A251|nr:penicillin-binding protein 1C [uncultured Defluviimonas sp.]MCB2124970.1 penicillin-binding protein 1C [Paracoccaceae bacterium]MCC0070957.1 penicillin-binding protein 1C [Paracoccaceae bacterium]
MKARVALALAALLFAGGLLRDGADLWIDGTVLPPLTVETGVEVTARDGTLLRAFTVADGRWRLDPGAVDRDFLAMLVAYEDKRFYQHNGLDPLALLRAVWQVAANGRVVSGGSTLTMQVARLLEESGTGRLSGKLRQIRVALALERRLTKDEILDLYLRLAPYGGNLEGVRAASLAYFGKEPRRLTRAESALLVALPQSPETRRPDRAPATAEPARDRVLARLTAAGALPVDRGVRTEPVPTTRRSFPALAPHLADRLRREDPTARRIATTIDPALQRSLEALAARVSRSSPARASLAILVADHRTGDILASVGSPDWTDASRAGFIDMTRALRSPGSTLKPFVYALAFDEGLAHPETLIEDRPVSFGPYAPQNFDRAFRGTVTAREALQLSLNIPVVSLTEAIGPARLLAALRRTGADPVLPGGDPGLAVALGGVGLTLEDLVGAYAALARLGAPVRLSARPGATQPEGPRLTSPEAAWLAADILAGLPPPANAPTHQIAYKTGTSYGHRDVWAVGFDGAHVVGVWLGRPDGASLPGAFGGELAAPILFDTFARIGPERTPLPPPPPSTLILPNARLPQPLQRFRPRGSILAPGDDMPEIAFPPDGARVEAGASLALKVRGGTPPFTWLANGAPAVLSERSRESALPVPGPGYLRLSVIDGLGASASATVTLGP